MALVRLFFSPQLLLIYFSESSLLVTVISSARFSSNCRSTMTIVDLKEKADSRTRPLQSALCAMCCIMNCILANFVAQQCIKSCLQSSYSHSCIVFSGLKAQKASFIRNIVSSVVTDVTLLTISINNTESSLCYGSLQEYSS